MSILLSAMGNAMEAVVDGTDALYEHTPTRQILVPATEALVDSVGRGVKIAEDLGKEYQDYKKIAQRLLEVAAQTDPVVAARKWINQKTTAATDGVTRMAEAALFNPFEPILQAQLLAKDLAATIVALPEAIAALPEVIAALPETSIRLTKTAVEELLRTLGTEGFIGILDREDSQIT